MTEAYSGQQPNRPHIKKCRTLGWIAGLLKQRSERREAEIAADSERFDLLRRIESLMFKGWDPLEQAENYEPGWADFTKRWNIKIQDDAFVGSVSSYAHYTEIGVSEEAGYDILKSLKITGVDSTGEQIEYIQYTFGGLCDIDPAILAKIVKYIESNPDEVVTVNENSEA